MPKVRVDGKYVKAGRSWEPLLKYDSVKRWLQRHSENTRDMYGRFLMGFCEHYNTTPDQLLTRGPKELRDLIMDYCLEIKEEGKSSLARHVRAGLKSFFNFHDVEIPFRRGIDTIHVSPKKLRQQRVPSIEYVYRMADVTNNLRDRAIILCLAQSGVRVSCLCRWIWSMVKDQLYPQVQVPVKLLITAELDHKILRYSRNFYTTFLAREGAEALREWLDYRMEYGWKPRDGDPLFVTFEWDKKTPTMRPISRQHVWYQVKGAARKLKLDGVWTHLFRKTFDNILAVSVPFVFKEALAGHNLPGSSEHYFDWGNVEELEKQYQATDWSRSGLSRINSLEKTIKEQREIIQKFKLEYTRSEEEKKDIVEEMEKMKKDISRVTEIIEKMEKRKRD